MERGLAAQLMDSVLQLSDQLNGIHEQLQALSEGAERDALFRALGSVMFELDAGLIRPLVRQYPDLDPDK
jgi:hypothetical protein